MGSAVSSDTDVIVVGAGPGGSATAACLARLGLNVTLLEKSVFPREKVCGDGITPRAVKALINLGIDVSEDKGWIHNKGLRVYNGQGDSFDLPWPELADYPNFGMTRKRTEFDQLLAEHAEKLGAKLLTGVNVTEPILDPKTDRVVGVKSKDGQEFTAPIVVAADGNSSRLSVQLGHHRNEKRPMGVAVRAYYKANHQTDDWMESWVELWDGKPGESNLLPGYVWIFGVGEGAINVGLGMLNTSKAFGKVDCRSLLTSWLKTVPQDWQLTEQTQVSKIQGAALPMAYNRAPAYYQGLVSVGDAAGLVSPFNGEGISYAIESAQMASEAISQALALGVDTRAGQRTLTGYPGRLQSTFGGYFRLGTIFTKLIANPTVMHLCVKYGLPRKNLMVLVNKLLAHLWDGKASTLSDRVLETLTRLAPTV